MQAVNVRHHKVGETDEPAIYRINDDVVIFLLFQSNSTNRKYTFWHLILKSQLKEYSVEIYEWHGKSWEPYVADDVQVQFYMMSPYVLKTLSTDKKVMHIIQLQTFCEHPFLTIIWQLQGHYFTAFKVPDIYGVFQFKVEYNRLGYTSVALSKQV